MADGSSQGQEKGKIPDFISKLFQKSADHSKTANLPADIQANRDVESKNYAKPDPNQAKINEAQKEKHKEVGEPLDEI